MTPVDHTSLEEQVQRTLRENRAALRVAERRARSRAAAARRSRIAVERAVRELRRAGLLK